MIPFVDALMSAKQALRDAGYPSAILSVCISPADVQAVQREFQVAAKIVEQALHPEPARFGMRLLAVVHDVHVYVREP